MEPRPLRIAYAIEYLLALIALFECWSQVGGQTPLDLMPWWLKLVFAAVFASVVVRLTVVSVRNEPFPAVSVIRWGLALAITLTLIALATYYYHLSEPVDEESDEPVTTEVMAPIALQIG